MNDLDKATMASIERCLLAGDTNSTKALNAAYELGRLQGRREGLSIHHDAAKGVFDEALGIMSGKVKPS